MADRDPWAEFEASYRRAVEIGDRGRQHELIAHEFDGPSTRHLVIEDEPTLSDGRWLIYGILGALAWLAVLWWMGAL